jgi:SAM-dependent methyltransferase
MTANYNNHKKTTSWETSHEWYDSIIGKDGHYYQTTLIFKEALSLLNLKADSSILDLGCGEGVLGRQIPDGADYLGIDISSSLIKKAQTKSTLRFQVADITQPLSLKKKFSHAALILVIQNIEEHEKVFENAQKNLQNNGKLLIIMNHPCFRIPRQSSWGIDEGKHLQYRRVDRYMEPMQIPIQTHPSQKELSPTTWSFHHPLSTYIQALSKNKFVIETLSELTSPKKSTGIKAKMENRCRKEFPLFLCLIARKIT